MGPLHPSPKASIESLPVELRQEILVVLPDVSALISAVLSHSALYQAFLGLQNQLLHDTVLKEVPPNLLNEARMVLSARKLAEKGRTREKVESLLATRFKDQRTPEPRWTLSDAAAISQLQSHVDFFTADLLPTTLSGSTDTSLTAAETARIQRAFYRFELYCNLFRDLPHQERHNPEEQKGLYFSHFSPWENEQLACIFEYLYKRLSPAYDDVAAHDIVWAGLGFRNDANTDQQDNTSKCHLLSHGLSFLHKVAKTETYQKQYKILTPAVGHDFDSLYEGLVEANTGDGEEMDLIDMSSDQERMYISPPFAEDSDDGPVMAWRWTHAHYPPNLFIFSTEHRGLRQQGYVLWDRARLWDLGFFQGLWEPPSNEGDADASERCYDAVVETLRARSEYSQRGGRGWWSKEDQSKILWPSKQGPKGAEYEFYNLSLYNRTPTPWKVDEFFVMGVKMF